MTKSKLYYIKTFGCQQNVADSERIASYLESQGMKPAKSMKTADYIVINSCMVRQSAENRVYGLVNNLTKLKIENFKLKIIVTGCMVGMAVRDKTGKYLKRLRSIMPVVDEFLPIEEIGFEHLQIRNDKKHGYVIISNGCNNFCTFCVVPFTRGREISRPYVDVINECQQLKNAGYTEITLLGMNVNSYGADLVMGEKNIQVLRDIPKKYFDNGIKGHSERSEESSKASINTAIPPRSFAIAQDNKTRLNAQYPLRPRSEASSILNTKQVKPIYVKHLGRYRIPTLFPYLLEDVAKIGFNNVNFISSNPWDFSDELIDVISRNKNISRTLHIAVQSGDDAILKKMNRWYTSSEFIKLAANLKRKVQNVKLTTDIIVGFCGETEEQFQNTVKLCKKVGFDWAYVNIYSPRPFAASTKAFADDIPHTEKRRRWQILDELINKPKLPLRSPS